MNFSDAENTKVNLALEIPGDIAQWWVLTQPVKKSLGASQQGGKEQSVSLASV